MTGFLSIDGPSVSHCLACAVRAAAQTSMQAGDAGDGETADHRPLEFFLPDEVATYLRVTTKALERWRRFGGGPPWCKFGGAIRYPTAEFAEWLRRQASEPQPA